MRRQDETRNGGATFTAATTGDALPADPSRSAGLRLDSQWIGLDPAANQLGTTTSTAVAVTIGS